MAAIKTVNENGTRAECAERTAKNKTVVNGRKRNPKAHHRVSRRVARRGPPRPGGTDRVGPDRRAVRRCASNPGATVARHTDRCSERRTSAGGLGSWPRGVPAICQLASRRLATAAGDMRTTRAAGTWIVCAALAAVVHGKVGSVGRDSVPGPGEACPRVCSAGGLEKAPDEFHGTEGG